VIIKANCLKNGRKLANYLLTENDRQKAVVLDMRGSLMNSLQATLNAWEKEALAVTKGEKPLYNVKIRLAPGETLAKSQWFHLLDLMEKKLKLTDHPRAVVAHYLDGEPHLHVVYSRLDRERGVLLKMSHDRRHLHDTCRQLEKEFGLRELDSSPRRERNGNERTRSIEHRMAKEAGTTRKALCDLVKSAWTASSTGREFQQQLLRIGITMTHGERRDYNVWHSGKRYDPVRLIENVRTAEFREKMQRDPPQIQAPGVVMAIAPVSNVVRRKAEGMTHNQAAPEFANDNVIQQRREEIRREFMRQTVKKQREKNSPKLTT